MISWKSKKQINTAIAEGLFSAEALKEGNYFILSGLTYYEQLNEKHSDEIIKVDVFYLSGEFAFDPEKAILEAKESNNIKLYSKSEFIDLSSSQIDNLNPSNILPSPYKNQSIESNSIEEAIGTTGIPS